jgi:serine protease inhibitor
LNEAHKNLSQAIPRGQTKVILDLANSIWCKKDAQLKPEFLAHNEKFYEAKVEALDFTDLRSVRLMNDWADQKQSLHALGMRLAFGDADFSAMAFAPLFLSTVKHKGLVEVSEEGTEAAASTMAGMLLCNVRERTRPFRMIVDRPFLFVIQDNLTMSILFMGIVVEPMASVARL